jgi:uncharacterized membrane protein
MELTSDTSTHPPNLKRWRSLIFEQAMVCKDLKDCSLRDALDALRGRNISYPDGAKGDRSLIDMAKDALVQSLKVEKTVTINRSPEDLYNFWHNLENLPKFSKHLESVKVIDPKRSHWIAAAPLGAKVEWDSEVVVDEANSLLGWASLPSADIENAGFVRFRAATGGRGTEVKVVMEYSIVGGAVTAAIAKIFGEEPELQVGEDLHRFKQLMETGEIATTQGQSSGRSD